MPDFSTLSRRGNGLALRVKPRNNKTAIHLAVDRTGLKIFSEGDWLERKHKAKSKRRSWRKLRLGLDLVSGEIVCSDLTTDNVGDPTALPDLLGQIDCPVDLFLADGVYDGGPTSDLLATRFGSTIDVTIPPPKTAVLSPNAAHYPTIRDIHIAEIKTYGRMVWQKTSGYNQRSRIEIQMARWKAVIGPKLKARCFGNQKTKAKIGVQVLNRMTRLGRSNFERNA